MPAHCTSPRYERSLEFGLDRLSRGYRRDRRIDRQRHRHREEARRSLQMVDGVELAIDLEPRRDRQLADFERVADRGAERDDASLKGAEDPAGAGVGCELLVIVTDQADGELLGEIFG